MFQEKTQLKGTRADFQWNQFRGTYSKISHTWHAFQCPQAKQTNVWPSLNLLRGSASVRAWMRKKTSLTGKCLTETSFASWLGLASGLAFDIIWYVAWKRGTGYSRSPKQGCLALLNMYPRLQSSHPGSVFEAQNPVIQTLNTTLQTAESPCPCPFLHVPFRTKESKGAKFCTQEPNSDLRGPGANSLDSLFRQSFNQGCNTCKA